MYTYLKFGLPRVFPPNGGDGSQRSNHRPIGLSNRDGPNRIGHVNRGYRETLEPGRGAAASSGYDSSDNENPRGAKPHGGRSQSKLRKFRSESDFRAINQGEVVVHGDVGRDAGRSGHSRIGSQMQASNNIPLAALRMATSRASIAGTNQYNHMIPNQANGSKHYGNRSHSEADLLGNEIYDYDVR